MDYSRYRLIFWVRMLFILMTAGLIALWIPRTTLLAVPIICIAILLYQVTALLKYMEKPQRDVQRFFDAIRYSDFTQTFSNSSTDKSLGPMKEAFNKVMDAFQKTRAEKEEHYRYLQTVVQHVGIGLLVFRSDGEIDLMNQAARRLLGISGVRTLDDLKKLKSSLPQTIKKLRPGEKAHVKLHHPETGDFITLSVFTTQFILHKDVYALVSIQNIQNELEEKELEAWQNLIRVLTHEMMNSITPIVSLASTAQNIIQSFNLLKDHSEPVEDVNEAIQTIRTRSEGLLKFVKSYRQLTRLPQPSFSIISINEFLSHIHKLMESPFAEKHVDFEYSVYPRTLEITADRNLIEQVLINLLQNALYWCSRKPGGKVSLTASMGPGSRPIIQVIDNGPGIQKEAMEKIFIPFFTTKEDGTGVGLSLSRQIMRLHKGHILAKSVPDQETIFILKF